ncbi:hypothetical protein ACFQ0T_09350 [Kitasatospora gansuensis]
MTDLHQAAAPAAAPAPSASPHRWRLVRWAAWPLYFVLLARWTYVNGLPYTDDLVFLWLIGALLAAAVHGGEGWRRTLSVLRDWVPVMAVVWTYSLLRGYGAHTPGRRTCARSWRSTRRSASARRGRSACSTRSTPPARRTGTTTPP